MFRVYKNKIRTSNNCTENFKQTLSDFTITRSDFVQSQEYTIFCFFLFLSTENVPRYYDCLFEMVRPREWNFDIGIQSRRVLRWLEFCVLRFSREIGLRHWWFGTRAAMRNKLKHVRNPCWESKRFHRDIRFHGVIINIRDRSIQISSLWLKRGVMPVTIINPVWFKSEKRW